MNHHSILSLNRGENQKGVMQTHCIDPSPVHNLLSAESKGQYSLNGNCSSDCLPKYRQTEPLEVFLSQPQMSDSSPVSNKPVSYSSNIQNPKSTFTCSSTFCTSLYLSSSTSSETHLQLGNPPFLPLSPTLDQCSSAGSSAQSSLVLGEDVINKCNPENSEDLMMNFLNVARVSSDASFQGWEYDDGLILTEQLELQYLSEELDIAINSNEENPRLGEIYETPQVSSIPPIELECNQNHHSSVTHIDNQIHSTHSLPGAAAAHKPRIRWTPELHELFLDAVDKIGGPENAAPKGIWRLMNVEGLNIDHVKSHLQKYRLAKNVPELKQEKKTSGSEKKMSASTSDDGDAQIKRGMQVTEALRLQIEIQKQLHEQLKLQKALQLRIEQNGEYLQKILEDDGVVIPINGLSSTKQAQPKNDCSHKASHSTETEQSRCQKRPRQENCSGMTSIENTEH